MSLLLRDQVKTILAVELDDDTFDIQIDTYLPIVTAWFETYCDRGLAAADRVEQIHDVQTRKIYLWAFPINSLASVVREDDLVANYQYRFNKLAGYIYPDSSLYAYPSYRWAQLLTVSYNGGYLPSEVPADLALAFATAVGVQGAVTSSVIAGAGGGGSAIKSIGLGGGALTVQFDTGAVSGGFSGTYDVSRAPPMVQPYASVLDYYVRQGA